MIKTYEDLGFAKVDHHRIKRKGFPEVIYCPGKTTKQIVEIAKRIYKKKHPVLMTRAEPKVYRAIKKVFKKAKYHKEARIVEIRNSKLEIRNLLGIRNSTLVIITAGTADIPVAEEAAVTAEFLGIKTERIFDVGVAGIHRLLKNLPKLQKAKVIIVVAGMEGALPSVVGGLVEAPVIAVPTSVGYGANFKGLAPLLTMMNSCAPGVAVVNIDNGFGAAVMAHAILKAPKH
ncbi:nickel pincer cofactor biosynthesis protein LarB [Candidatus Margulisiibacteriota bacterium]